MFSTFFYTILQKAPYSVCLYSRGSGGSRHKCDRGSTLQVWALWVWWAWLAWKLDLCDDVVKQNPMISIFRKLGSLKSDRGSRPSLDPPLSRSIESHAVANTDEQNSEIIYSLVTRPFETRFDAPERPL